MNEHRAKPTLIYNLLASTNKFIAAPFSNLLTQDRAKSEVGNFWEPDSGAARRIVPPSECLLFLTLCLTWAAPSLLWLGSGQAQVYSGLLRSAHPTNTSHQKSSTFDEGPERKPLRLARGTNFINIIHPERVIPSAYLHLKCKKAKILFVYGLTLSFESSSFTTASCPFPAANDNGVRQYSMSLESGSIPFSVSSSFLCSGQAAPPPEACVLCHSAKKQVS